MVLPLILLIVGTLAAAMVAYGTHPLWAQYPHGIELILISRRLEWPLLAVVVILCVAMFAIVVAGKWRAWWLVGLAPILALLVHHFILDPDNAFAVNTQPAFVEVDQAGFVQDDDYVVGLTIAGQAYAYPYQSLYAAPLVMQSEQATPLMLMWSAFSNRALAVRIDRSIKPREMEIVSMPANTLLVYNQRAGQFINGVTGLTMDGQKPSGFGATIPTMKMTWSVWRTLHPATKVLIVLPGKNQKLPTGPILPVYPMPRSKTNLPAGTMVALICTTQPAVMLEDDLGDDPRNAMEGPLSLLLVRDKQSGCVKAFDRQVKGDLFPMFTTKTFVKFPQATMVDSDSNSPWTSDGRSLDGPLKGEKLNAVDVDDEVNYDVLAMWYPNLPVVKMMADRGTTETPTTPPPPGRRRRIRPAPILSH